MTSFEVLSWLVSIPPSLLQNSSQFVGQYQVLSLNDMAFTIRRPFALSSALRSIPKPTSTTSATLQRSIHNPAFRPVKPSQALTSPRKTFQDAFRRGYQTPATIPTPTASGSLVQRLLYGGALVGGTLLATNLIFNRETREDGGMPPFEREYLNQTFMHTGLGIGIIGVAASALHKSGWSYRLMAASPWVVIGGGLAMSIGTMYATFSTSPDK